MEMRCEYCGGIVLWDWPIKPYGPNSTTCQECGEKNCQKIEENKGDE